MSKVHQNKHIGKLIVGAMSIDGTLARIEREKVAATLNTLGVPELIADVGLAIDEDYGDFNLFEECKALMDSLGNEASSVAPEIFHLIASVIASDRFVSSDEALYLSAMARRLKLSTEVAKKILKQVMAERRGRLELAGNSVDALIHPHLKELLSFTGAEELVGELGANSLEEMLHEAREAMEEGSNVSHSDVERSLLVLGLSTTASLDEAEEVWKSSIKSLNLVKLAELGETFVTAALDRIGKVHSAYKTILNFHESLEASRKGKSEAQRLQGQIERSQGPSTRNNLSEQIEADLTGVASNVEPPELSE